MAEFAGHVFIGVSLDGFIAREDGSLDWLTGRGAEESTAEGPHAFDAFIDSVDGLIMGRSTYETVLAMEIEWPYGDKPIFVLSTTLDPGSVERPSVSVHHSVDAVLAAFAEAGFSDAYVDGGKTIQTFLAAGLIKRMIISRAPVLIGSGHPMFGELPADLEWELVRSDAIGGGFVQTEYQAV